MNLGYIAIVSFMFMMHVITAVPLMILYFCEMMYTHIVPSVGVVAAVRDAKAAMFRAVYETIDAVFFRMRVRSVIDPKVLHSGTYVFAPNHSSMFDFFLLMLWPSRVFFVVKDSFRWIPFIGFNLSHARCLFKDRSRRDAFVSRAVHRIQKTGESFCIFPEGTRVYDRGPMSACVRSGFVHVAQQAGVPILPLYHTLIDVVDDSTCTYNWHMRGRVITLVGNPIPPTNDAEQMLADYIKEMHRLYKDATSAMQRTTDAENVLKTYPHGTYASTFALHQQIS